MCRLFGFRSVIQSQVHSSLVSAENALEIQSRMHPDGWGVAYYIAGIPHIIKTEQSALRDALFKRVSGIVSSQTVVAHIRKATAGDLNILNTHPFQFGPWVFAHNGNIKNFNQYRDEIARAIPANLKRFILGHTDSELIFYFILGHLQKQTGLQERHCPYEKLETAVQASIQDLTRIVGDFSTLDDAEEEETYLTFLLTNGESIIAHQGGKKLYYSTYKTFCADRDDCPSYSDECESPTQTGFVNHLIFASEPLSGDNIWRPMELGQTIGLDAQMKINI